MSYPFYRRYAYLKDISLSYNLPGIGYLTVQVFPYTESIMSFLDKKSLVKKLHDINQLGSLNQIFKGAHHTRYEYVLLQWAIISELATKKDEYGEHLRLSAELKKFGKLPNQQKFPSGTDILQCLALLTNIGHFKETFAASRAFLHVLRKERNVRKAFSSGLDKNDRQLLKQVINDFDEYRIHLMIALFLLQRYKRLKYGSEHVKFCSQLLRKYLCKDEEENHSLKRLLNLYDSVRRTAYLVLDSYNSPIPFKIDTNSLFLDSIAYQLFSEENLPLKAAFFDIERVLQNSVYMSNEALLASQCCTDRIVERFKKNHNKDFKKIRVLFELLSSNSSDGIFKSTKNLDYEKNWCASSIVEQKFTNISNEAFKKLFSMDYYEFVQNSVKSLGKQSCLIGCQKNGTSDTFKIAFAPKRNIPNAKTLFLTKISIVAFALKFEMEKKKENYENPCYEENMQRLLIFLLKGLFLNNYRILLDHSRIKGTAASPFIVATGMHRTKNLIEDYKRKTKAILTENELFEVTKVSDVIQTLGFRGKTMCYLGSTKILAGNEVKAEFDGLIIFPNISPKKDSIIIVEAKNTRNGTNKAKKQLEDRLKALLNTDIFTYNISNINKAAFAKIKIR